MEEKNKNLIIVIILMAVVIVGLTGYIIYDKLYTDKNNTEEKSNNSNKENEKTKEDEIIKTSITKEQVNEELKNSIGLSYYAYKLTTSPINTNIFDSDYAKLYLAYMITINKNGTISEECYNSEGETGCATVDLKKFEEHYKNLFETDFSTNKYKELNQEGSYTGYKDNKFFGSFPTGITPDTLLKATSITEKKNSIEIDVDILKFDEDDERYNELEDSKITEYDNKLVVAKYKLILSKNENKTHKLISFTRIN